MWDWSGTKFQNCPTQPSREQGKLCDGEGRQCGRVRGESVVSNCHVRALLSRINDIPSPVFSLLNQTSARPEGDWPVARDHIVRWCVFGQRDKLVATLRRVSESARVQAAREPRALKALEVIAYILKETAPLEPELGLRSGVLK